MKNRESCSQIGVGKGRRICESSQSTTKDYQKPKQDSVSSVQLTSYMWRPRKVFSQDKNKRVQEPTSRASRDKPCYTVQCHDSFRGGATHYPYECPVEIQTQEPLLLEGKKRVIKEMEEEFRARRKVLITGLPHDCSEEVSEHYAQNSYIHTVSEPVADCVTYTLHEW